MAKTKPPKQQLNHPAMAHAPAVTCIACNWRKPSQDLIKRMAAESPDKFSSSFDGYTFVKYQGSVLALAYAKGRQISAFPLAAEQVADFAEMMNQVANDYLAEMAAEQAEADAPAPQFAELGDLSDPENEAGREAIRKYVAEQAAAAGNDPSNDWKAWFDDDVEVATTESRQPHTEAEGRAFIDAVDDAIAAFDSHAS